MQDVLLRFRSTDEAKRTHRAAAAKFCAGLHRRFGDTAQAVRLEAHAYALLNGVPEALTNFD